MSSSEDPSRDSSDNNRDRDTATLLNTSSQDIENGNGETRISLDDSADEHMVELDDHQLPNPMDDPELEEIAKDTSTLAQWLQRGYVNLKSRTKSKTSLKRASFHEGTKLEMSPSGFKWKKKSVQQQGSRPTKPAPMSPPGSPPVARRAPPQKENFSFFKTHWRKRFSHYYFTTLYLIVLGMITACLGAAVDVGIFFMITWRNQFMELTTITFFKWVLWTLFLIGTVIVCIIWTAYIAPSASGSGVPEMKTILSGMELGNSLSFRCLVTKTVGLVMSLGSGLSIGKVGPFVHVGCMVANQLGRLTIFENLKKSPAVMQQMIGTGCAVGYACSLGAPIGGVLLSVEITSAYYPVRNYWFSYLGALAGAVTFRYVRNTFLTHPGLSPLVEVDFKSEIHLGLLEIVIFVLLGVVAGLLGVLFIKINAFALKKWKAFTKKNNILKSPYMLAVVIGVITGTVTFPYLFGKFMSIPAFWQLQDLCRDDLTKDNDKLHAKDWERFPLGVSLLLSFLMRYFLTAVSVLIPVPAGLYAPILAAGSALGRTFGELINLITQNDTLRQILLWEGGSIVPGGYAVAGAAALAAGVTHTQSSAIVVLELTGQIYYLLPILISVVTAVAVAKKFSSLSIYDSVAKMRGLPYLPDVQQITYDIVVKDIMNPSVKYITKEFKYDHIIKLLAEADFATYPVVDSEESMLLIGMVHRPVLDAAVRDYFEKLRKLQRGLARHETVVQETLDSCPDLVFESAPIQLLPSTSLVQAHMLFITLRLAYAYVTNNGKLIGLLTRGDLKETISKKDLSLTVLRE